MTTTAKTICATPYGAVRIAWDAHSGCLMSVGFYAGAVPDDSIRQVPPVIHPLIRFCRGEDVDLSRVPLAMAGLSSFQRDVYAYERTIPRGTVMSYRALAGAIGKPRATRAVARAQAMNPFLFVVPCHRIICADGSLGGFSAGIKRKIALLRAEGFVVEKRGVRWFVRGTAGTQCLVQ